MEITSIIYLAFALIFLAVVVLQGVKLLNDAKDPNASEWKKCLYSSTATLMLLLSFEAMLEMMLIIIEGEITDNERTFLTIVETATLPAMGMIIYVLTRHIVPLPIYVFSHYLPFVMLIISYFLFDPNIIVKISVGYAEFYGVILLYFAVMYGSRYSRALRDTYADINGRGLSWLYGLLGIMAVVAILWNVACLFKTTIIDLLYYPLATVLWLAFAKQIRKQKEAVEIGQLRFSGSAEPYEYTSPSMSNSAMDLKLEDICRNGKLYTDNELTATKLAEKVGCSRQELSEYFSSKGMTFYSFINTLRLENAARELVETDDAIAAIAKRNGFLYEKHFFESFEQMYGCAPREYRMKMRSRTSL